MNRRRENTIVCNPPSLSWTLVAQTGAGWVTLFTFLIHTDNVDRSWVRMSTAVTDVEAASQLLPIPKHSWDWTVPRKWYKHNAHVGLPCPYPTAPIYITQPSAKLGDPQTAPIHSQLLPSWHSHKRHLDCNSFVLNLPSVHCQPTSSPDCALLTLATITACPWQTITKENPWPMHWEPQHRDTLVHIHQASSQPAKTARYTQSTKGTFLHNTLLQDWEKSNQVLPSLHLTYSKKNTESQRK